MNDGLSGSMTGFDRLHPAVQYHIVNSLRWPALRPLQASSVDPILDRHHALLIAPTAGGKTEAAMLPVLSMMVTEEWHGVSVLYLCPIKALLNNLEARLTQLSGYLGRTVQVWHGDIGQGQKKRAEAQLPDILLTTPESLEGILIGSRRDHRRLLGNVRCVIADEAHAFAGDDRGWHLLALLERIQSRVAWPIQRIGLSATVGAPQTLLDWLAGHSPGVRSLVQISAPPAAVELRVDHVGSLNNAALLISQLHQGEKRLVFCDSRSKVEELALALRALEIDVFVSHAALSADTRRMAEQAFAERQNCVIVATSTLELGLDVGDLDRVIQIDAPGSVASFMQRMGRTGRRAASTRNTLFLATRDEGLLEALAIVSLFQDGYVEPVRSPPMPCHLVAQQLFAMLFEYGLELNEQVYLDVLGRVPGFAEVLDDSWLELRAYLIDAGYLIRTGTMLSLGEKAEARFRGRGLADLCVSFESPRLFAAMRGNTLLGHIDPLGLSARKDGNIVLALGGRSWRVVAIDWMGNRVYVEEAVDKGKIRWLGSGRGVSRVIAERVRRIIDSGQLDDNVLTRRSRERLSEIREELAHTLAQHPRRQADHSFQWWTYEGLAANSILAARITAAGGRCSLVDSYAIRFTLDTDCPDGPNWEEVRATGPVWTPNPDQRVAFAELLPGEMLQGMSWARVENAARE